jgi:co-chaperonin GroES (HSP10)
MLQQPKEPIQLPEKTKVSGLAIPAGKSNLAIILLADRIIIKEMKEEMYNGTMIYRGDEKEELKQGTVQSLGTVIPPGYEMLELNLAVEFKGQTATKVIVPEDPDGIYHLLRISDVAHII